VKYLSTFCCAAAGLLAVPVFVGVVLVTVTCVALALPFLWLRNRDEEPVPESDTAVPGHARSFACLK